jgi:hypothetical protein
MYCDANALIPDDALKVGISHVPCAFKVFTFLLDLRLSTQLLHEH